MKSWREYRLGDLSDVIGKHFVETTVPGLARECLKYFTEALKEDGDSVVCEGAEASRYSIEVNYRTKLKDAEEAFAKVTLGYVSAAMKNSGYHCKLVFDEEPLRVIVSSRNWDDGEWVGMVSFNPHHHCFVLSKGFYNRERKTVSVQKYDTMKGNSASDIANDLRNMMHNLKGQPDRHLEKLKPVPLKRGPKG